MNIDILVAIIGILGIAVAAYFARRQELEKSHIARAQELEKSRRDQLAKVYAMYLDAVAVTSSPIVQAAHAKAASGANLSQQELEVLQQTKSSVVNAHSNILVYGTPRVIAALNQFYEGQNQRLPMEELNPLLIQLVSQMRADSNSQDYPEFGDHVDNIIGLKSELRALRHWQGQSQPTGGA